MKRWMVLLAALVLTGCGVQETFETVTDDLVVPAMARPGHISVELPGETALPVMESDSDRLYLGNDYEILVQTMDAGDMEQTLRTLTGRGREDLTVVETRDDGCSRYEFVWASAGEGGSQTGRGLVLDDGSYHYCLSVLRDAEQPEKSQINWDQVFSSFCVESY